MEINKMKLRVFEGFAGYGGASFALRKIKEKYPQFNGSVLKPSCKSILLSA